MWKCPSCARFTITVDICLDCGFSSLVDSGEGLAALAADELLQEGLASVARGQRADMHRALRCFIQSTTRNPDYEKAWLGRIFMVARLFPDALQRQLACWEASISGVSAAQKMFSSERGIGALKQGSFLRIAQVFRNNKQPPQALFILDFALAMAWADPAESARLWQLKAEVELAMGEPLNAIGSLQQAEALGSTDDAVQYIKGLEHERQGSPEQALRAYTAARRHEPLRALATLSTVRLLAGQGQTYEAMATCKDALAIGVEHPGLWRVYTKLALMLGLSAEARVGIQAIEKEAPGSAQESHFPGLPLGYPLPARTTSSPAPEALFALKLPRLLEERGALLDDPILIRGWSFLLPPLDGPGWPLGKLAGQSLTAELITRGRRAIVACHAPSPRLVDASILGPDEINAWSWLVERGVPAVTFAANTLPAPPVRELIRQANERLGRPPEDPALTTLVVGERAGILGLPRMIHEGSASPG